MNTKVILGSSLIFRILLCMTLVVSVKQSARADPWANSISPESTSRYIPFELWTVAKWSGNRDLAQTRADLTFRFGGKKTIKGPADWTHPATGNVMKIYTRKNKSKVQYFAVRRNGDGLGPVYDSRSNRIYEDGIKFPLGQWRQGETGRFSCTCWKKGRPYGRTVQITMDKIDFTHNGIRHALRYRWIADGGNKRGLDMLYTYAPGLGNTEIKYKN